MADELVEQMEQLDIESPSLFGLPTDAIQNIFNYLRVSQKQLAEEVVKESREYKRFMRTPILPSPSVSMTPQENYDLMVRRVSMTPQERLELINEREREFIANSPINIPYQVALRYFRDLARRRGHNIN